MLYLVLADWNCKQEGTNNHHQHHASKTYLSLAEIIHTTVPCTGQISQIFFAIYLVMVFNSGIDKINWIFFIEVLSLDSLEV